MQGIFTENSEKYRKVPYVNRKKNKKLLYMRKPKLNLNKKIKYIQIKPMVIEKYDISFFLWPLK